MNCQRCGEPNQVTHKVRSEILDLKVCTPCALEAVELLGPGPSDLRMGRIAVDEMTAVAVPATN